ncbi:MAG: UDP-N-acetylmuramoyl-tripeptide--D-alanyl-D-alanine ligase [Gemmatimonadetes bacterium]|nr:UDP-N-acetylmuramoyl-tripeptide--D-alanyl-D-alanine ligase [Gemmatimonadota bacterium]
MTAFEWSAQRVTEALGLPRATWEHAYTGISTDTRTLKEGELFVALRGERFDAHDFLGEARLAGVGGVVVRRGTPRWPGFDWFEVDDTRAALGRLARYRREGFAGPVVAVTGTNGKTSTKEMIAAALAPRFSVHRSERNLNNLVGVPLTVLATPLDAEAAVVECGASLPGEIATLRDIVRPDVAVVTNVEAGHLEGFGSLEVVLEEKVALLVRVRSAVVGVRPPHLPEAARRVAGTVVTAGLEGKADWCPEAVTLLPDGRPRLRVRGVEVELAVHGRHMVANALLALAVADALAVPLDEAAAGVARARVPGGRSEVLEIEGVTIINDSYNANPSSLDAALDLLAGVCGGRRAVVVLGSMRELGAGSAALHRAAAERVLAARPAVIAAVGDFVPAFRAAARGSPRGGEPILFGDTAEAIAPRLKQQLRPGDVVLVKASRAVALEQLFPLLWPDHAPGGTH